RRRAIDARHSLEVADFNVGLEPRIAAILAMLGRLTIRAGMRKASDRQTAGAFDVRERESLVMTGIGWPGQSCQVVALINHRMIGQECGRRLATSSLEWQVHTEAGTTTWRRVDIR